MTVYIVLMLLALAGYAFSANASEINRKRYLCLVFSAIVIVAMLRSDQIGIDLSHYYNKYYPLFKNVSWDKLQSVTISGDWELGFCAFCKIIGQISTSTQCFVIFTSLFSIIPYAHFIYRNSDDVVFSTVFFGLSYIYDEHECNSSSDGCRSYSTGIRSVKAKTVCEICNLCCNSDILPHICNHCTTFYLM